MRSARHSCPSPPPPPPLQLLNVRAGGDPAVVGPFFRRRPEEVSWSSSSEPGVLLVLEWVWWREDRTGEG